MSPPGYKIRSLINRIIIYFLQRHFVYILQLASSLQIHPKLENKSQGSGFKKKLLKVMITEINNRNFKNKVFQELSKVCISCKDYNTKDIKVGTVHSLEKFCPVQLTFQSFFVRLALAIFSWRFCFFFCSRSLASIIFASFHDSIALAKKRGVRARITVVRNPYGSFAAHSTIYSAQDLIVSNIFSAT